MSNDDERVESQGNSEAYLIGSDERIPFCVCWQGEWATTVPLGNPSTRTPHHGSPPVDQAYPNLRSLFEPIIVLESMMIPKLDQHNVPAWESPSRYR